MELSTTTKTRAKRAGWSDELIERIEASAASDNQVENLARGELPEDRINGWLDFLENHPDNPFAKAPFNIFNSPAEIGLKATPGEDGLRLRDINIGSYGIVPDEWGLPNDAPRGTISTGLIMAAGYSIFDKAEVWSENAVDLYEDAIKDRWAPATDLDWDHGMSDMPEELERAFDQICTIYSNNGLVEQKIIGRWLEEISYGFHEVKLFLATQAYDAGRKVEVLRKRALANGGGLGKAPLGQIYRGWYAGLTFTDMIIALNVVYKSYEVSMFEAASEWAQSDFDRDIFARLAADSRRHLDYGLGHLEWYERYKPEAEKRLGIQFLRAEAAMVQEMRLSTTEREALVVLLAGGVENLQAGVDKLKTLRQRQYDDYLENLASINFDRPTVHPGLAGQIVDPLEGGVVAVRAVSQS
ncbi:MAG: ferritin-like domain-containing protein [Chloroflexi bacterium]|nr:ferritin-like domain-containing protein [Chloroflexota bacterium]MCY3697198.1 ferritin-like domain-containing protein [Chloroflexota bacterium]MXX80396.1 ferritin-like domain-containing protein [Chloroflexota bacterium]MYB22917.1 ferritin-like domain-containing protein [Chloroflexota bacterium]MYF22859.1 ferritin-like domain-containing protein [Chloroflexota bacterium]